MMNKQMTAAYTYYKEKYPTMAILFRVRNSFHAYFEDADKISAALHIPPDPNHRISLPADQILKYISKLYKLGVLTKMISYRNDAGEFDIPDVNSLKIDQDIDY